MSPWVKRRRGSSSSTLSRRHVSLGSGLSSSSLLRRQARGGEAATRGGRRARGASRVGPVAGKARGLAISHLLRSRPLSPEHALSAELAPAAGHAPSERESRGRAAGAAECLAAVPELTWVLPELRNSEQPRRQSGTHAVLGCAYLACRPLRPSWSGFLTPLRDIGPRPPPPAHRRRRSLTRRRTSTLCPLKSLRARHGAHRLSIVLRSR